MAWDALLETLVTTRRRALVGYAYVLTGDISEAEDLVHDAILRTFATARGLTGVGHAEGYVRKAIATQFLNRRRSHKRLVGRMHLFHDPGTPRDPQDGAGSTDAVRAALQRLTPRERACVVLRHMEQMRVSEIAHTLGIAEGTVKRYLSDATARLTAELGAEFGEDIDAVPVTQSPPGRPR